MSWEAWVTIGTIAVLIVALATERVATDLAILGAVGILVLIGTVVPGANILSISNALAGLANEGVMTVGAMYIVSAGLVATGSVRWVGQRFLGRSRTIAGAQLRLLLPVTGLSAFINNTPLVAMLIPVVADWCRQQRLSVSKFMIPLSYAAILGGVCTLIGTSTNLVFHGKWLESGRPPMGLFEMAWVGVPVAIAGLVYLIAVGRALLPDRAPVLELQNDPRSYTVEMLVEPGSPLVGQSIEKAGLRGLVGLFLAEIERQGATLPAVGPDERLRANDRLVFVGVVDSVVDLQKIRGLKPATDQVVKLTAPRPERRLIEAVVSDSSPLIGQSVREGRFRSVYNAVVIAVARNGERLRDTKIGDIVLRAGDTLLLEAPRSFVEQQRNSREFLLVSAVAGSEPVNHERAGAAIAVLAAMVGLAAWGPAGLGMVHAAFLAAALMVLFRCCSAATARRAVDWQVLVVIAASLALGKALENSGAAGGLANALADLASGNPLLTLALIYGATMLLTETVTNNAAALLMFPIAEAAAARLGADFKPFAMCVMVAASAGFASPLGYQTHLMVMAPGHYRFRDFLRVGIPLDLIAWAVTVPVAALVWPLRSV